MADPRFFPKSGTLSLEKIIALTGATAQGESRIGSFDDVAPLDRAGAVGALAEDGRVFLAIRLEGDALTIRSQAQTITRCNRW